MKTYLTRDQNDIVFLLVLTKLKQTELIRSYRNMYGQLEVEFNNREFCESAIDQMNKLNADKIQPRLMLDALNELKTILKKTKGPQI